MSVNGCVKYARFVARWGDLNKIDKHAIKFAKIHNTPVSSRRIIYYAKQLYKSVYVESKAQIPAMPFHKPCV